MIILKIKGTDYTEKIPAGGIKWAQNSMDGDKAGRTLDGVAHRDFIANKATISMTLDMLTGVEMTQLCSDLSNEFFSVTYLNPSTNTMRTANFYQTSISNSVQRVDMDNGQVYYTSISFNLIEQ